MNKIVKMLVEYYGVQLTSLQLGIYNRILDKYSSDPQSLILEIASTCREFPSVADIIGIIEGCRYGDIRGDAIEITDKIVGAVRAFGYYNVQGAYDYIGESGWRVVDEFGGWRSICENELGIVTLRKYLTEKAYDLIKDDRDMSRRERLGIDKTLLIDSKSQGSDLKQVPRVGQNE